mgnify:CR=1 FL=1
MEFELEYNEDCFIESDDSDTENENLELIEFENDILNENNEYQELVDIIEIIENFRRYNNPLILDELNKINLIKFLTNTE